MEKDSKDYELERLKYQIELQEDREKWRRELRQQWLKWGILFAVSFAIAFYFKFDVMAWMFGR